MAEYLAASFSRAFRNYCDVFRSGIFPSLRGGVAAPVRKCREATATGADGVVAHKQRFGVSDHPSAPLKEASQHFS
jgi:hypothetical protein